MAILREAWGIPNGFPAPAPLIELAAIFLRTESELVLKSRRVVPGRLLDAGFQFNFPTWPEAAEDLVYRGAIATIKNGEEVRDQGRLVESRS